MRYTQQTKDDVRRAYIVSRLSLTAISDMLKIPYQTVARWKKQAGEAGDDWDTARTADTMAGGDREALAGKIMASFMVQVEATQQLIESDPDMQAETRVKLLASLSDSYIKITNANDKTMPKTSKLAVAIEVLTKLSEYVREHKPELLSDFMDVLEPFGEQIAKELK